MGAETTTSALYTVKPMEFKDEFGVTERGAQKLFKRYYLNQRTVPEYIPGIGGLPIIALVGDRYRMLRGYFEAIKVRRSHVN